LAKSLAVFKSFFFAFSTVMMQVGVAVVAQQQVYSTM
jgi:hypothetical protein